MDDAARRDLVERVHAAGCQSVIAVTGGGSQAIADLLTVPGASNNVLEAVVPYAAEALAAWLGGSVDQACSEMTARAMAMAAFERARKLSKAEPRTLYGIGATASLATTQPKRGAHRVHVAWQSAGATVAYSTELVKSRRTRIAEESLTADMILHAVAEAAGVLETPLADHSADEPIQRREQRAPEEWIELLLGRRQSVICHAEVPSKLIFSGAFHPLHEGHRRMAKVAASRCSAPVTMEISIVNVEKPALDFLEIADRCNDLAEFPIVLTRAATFAEKADVIPDAVFLVGADTIARIGDPVYYGDDTRKRDSAIAALAARGCRFLVFGRTIGTRFSNAADLPLPSALRALCEFVPESEFRVDVSSTELRAAGR